VAAETGMSGLSDEMSIVVVLAAIGGITRHTSHDRSGHGRLSHHQERTMKFRPLHDRVVLRRLNAEEKTAGGIIIPDTAKEKPQEGEVVAVGPGARNEQGQIIPLEVKAGDRILFGKWSGTEVKIDGEELLIMKESDIMGIIDHVTTKAKAA
jgi:chaperonin GroES